MVCMSCVECCNEIHDCSAGGDVVERSEWTVGDFCREGLSCDVLCCEDMGVDISFIDW